MLVDSSSPPAAPPAAPPAQPEPMLRFFRYEHLPPHLQAFSKVWHDFARHLVETLPRNAERTVALRKLLEGKDAAVRSTLPENP